MLTDKELKKKYRPIFWKDPEKYFPVKVLKEADFKRGICKKCNMPFWNKDHKREVCGDPNCAPHESFGFIGKSPAKFKLDYVEVWKKFSSMFKGFGYTPIARYPVVARWNPTMEYTNASIAAFQPFVISGEVEPPANPLVIPQFCIRFLDIDNVGITMSHNTGFVMIGQHMFVKPQDWNQEKVFRDIKAWLNEGLGVSDSELTFHEDAWAGGGNLGCCMEFFSRGCEIGNQVYMLFEQTATGEIKDLDIKVLDMGMGMERNAWFSQGANTIYDSAFGPVVSKLLKKSGLVYDDALLKKYVPYAGLLNIDEVEDMDKAWKDVSLKTGIPVDKLKSYIIPLSGIYSIAEHSRTLLFSLSDGAIPSNVGGAYNLRILTRRALSFIDRYKWDIDLFEVCKWHADYLKPIFPELSLHLEEVGKIIDSEKVKYLASVEKTSKIISKLDPNSINSEKLIELYDSNGISPEIVKDEFAKRGFSIKVPDNFYALVADRHQHAKDLQTFREEQIAIGSQADTEILYYGDYKLLEFKAKVLKIVDNFVVLDKTAFYPTSGGQMHDIGKLDNVDVIDVFKQGKVIIHKCSSKPSFKEGATVTGLVDSLRRTALAQNHTATHIVNAASRRVLGNHVNQAGARKTPEKATLDITHYQNISNSELEAIEKEANHIIKSNLNVIKSLLPRNDAEKKYGMAIYQGGAVPGKLIRIVEIPTVEVEACGGTHLNKTGEAILVKILSASKIQDGVIRLEFVAGNNAENYLKNESSIASQIGVKSAKELTEIASFFAVPLNQVLPTIDRFRNECESKISKIISLREMLNLKDKEILSIPMVINLASAKKLFEFWKTLDKEIELLSKEVAMKNTENIVEGSVVEMDVDLKTMLEVVKSFENILLINPVTYQFVFKGNDSQFNVLKSKFGARGGGKDVKQGMFEKSDVLLNQIKEQFKF